ncbi:condensation domain-containing protein [Streptomyces caatingaensis]|uniref:Acyltransferase papA2 n=1 Tax=Streptomyces caatingaensis TaxID=1678637 RepID=A0A0K9XHD0_9ACTN|nr:condensation domain-containing protein [Streptomyces caatingaensis]KNB52790.1 acyltransferase papA2 [Streptomyces caatingaensis]
MTDIQRCEVRPGLLVEWTLDPAVAGAAADAPEDPRPPAYVQESHIRTARSVREDGLFVPTWLGTAFDLRAAAGLDTLQEALRTWTLRHETLRSGFRWSGDTMRRFTLRAEDVALRRTVVGHFADAEALVACLQDRFDVMADALSWPNFLYTAVVRDDGTSVYMAFDHSNVDAYSIQRIPAEIHALCGPAGEGKGEGESEPTGSYIDFCGVERANADRIDDGHAIVARWREFISRCDGRLPNFPLDLGLEPDGKLPTQKLLHEMLVDAGTAAAFDANCRAHGGSLAGVLAATAVVVHRLGGAPVYRTVVPFHTRVKSRWLDSVGWYVGGAPVEIDVTGADDFRTVLERVRAALRAAVPLARVPVARVLRLLGADFRPTSPDLYSIVSYVDARSIPGSAHWTAQKAYGLVRVSYGDQVCVWLTRLHEGLQLAARHPDTGPAHASMRRYVAQLRSLIAEVAGEGAGVRL